MYVSLTTHFAEKIIHWRDVCWEDILLITRQINALVDSVAILWSCLRII